MNLEIYQYIFWPTIMAISISKPISDYFWLRKFENKSGFLFSIKELVFVLFEKQYLIMLFAATIFWLLTFLLINYVSYNPLILAFVILVFSVLFIVITIYSIKSILVAGLIAITYANFLLIYIFQPLTSVQDLSTLNNLLSNLITTFNYIALATAAAGLVWQFGRHQKEDIYGTVSTMFYAIGYILLNMFISFLYLFLPTINQI